MSLGGLFLVLGSIPSGIGTTVPLILVRFIFIMLFRNADCVLKEERAEC